MNGIVILMDEERKLLGLKDIRVHICFLDV